MAIEKNSRSFTIQVLPDNRSMGETAGREAAKILRLYIAKKRLDIMAVFAAAPSQDTFLARLCREKGINWTRVHAFHLDEYLDLPKNHPNSFQVYLKEHILDKVAIPRNRIHYMKDIEGTQETVISEYAQSLKNAFMETRKAKSIYVACIGIGVNGHIAFNEPGTNLWTKDWVTGVTIDETSVQQQFDDYKNHPDPAARYKTPGEVPRNVLTMTCAGILAADVIFCMVPGAHKAGAVSAMVEGPITDAVPASLLRLHKNVHLYLDEDSARTLKRI